MILKYIIPLSAFTISTLAQSANAIDISATGNEDPVMRICIEGETAERNDYSLTEQIDACTVLIEEKSEGWTAALYSRAQHYYDAKREKDALAEYDTLAELTPENPSIWYGRAKSYVRWYGPFQAHAAIDYISEAIRLSTDKPRSAYYLYRAEITMLADGVTDPPVWTKEVFESIRSDLDRIEELDQSGISKLTKLGHRRHKAAKDLLNMLIEHYGE